MVDDEYLHSFIEKSCSLTTYSNITSDILSHTSIFPSNINDTINVILHYNNTYSEYQKIDLNNIEDSLCPINTGWSGWLSCRVQEIYEMICNFKHCINNYNPEVSDRTMSIFKKLDTRCFSNIDSNKKGGTSMVTTVKNDSFIRYNQIEASIKNKTAAIMTKLSLLDKGMTSIENQNRELESRLKKVTQERDELSAKVDSLSAEKLLLEENIRQLKTNITITQGTVQELQSNLSRTNHELESSNTALHGLKLVITKLKDGVGNTLDTLNVTEALNYFEAKQTNYTNYQDTNERNKKSIDTLLSNAQRDVITKEQKIQELKLELQRKDIELNKTGILLDISISNIDNIHANITQLFEKHNISPRDINNQYNETPDSYAVSQQIMEDTYEARVADSERKVEEILTIFTSLEKENNILKSQIHQNEGKEIDNLQNCNLTESNINTSLIVLPDDYASAINSTNKSIGSTEVNPYYITAGSIAFSAVALYLVNKYCFVITKWPIMAYKYIARSCDISNRDIKNNATKLSELIVQQHDNSKPIGHKRIDIDKEFSDLLPKQNIGFLHEELGKSNSMPILGMDTVKLTEAVEI
ncbi:hypothetical protein [Rickettsia endosymbiont of Polydrusus tereticollis]|uniref:hypothetical protein n=1 Tax=Rickettsia endosymbiont of Polydrusus tereticollis TaxID=3066251 RepID=UPI003132E10A